VYELVYWCQSRGIWLRVEAPEYDDLAAAAVAAYAIAAQSRMTVAVIDESGEIVWRS
jgi:hypothetical protein